MGEKLMKKLLCGIGVLLIVGIALGGYKFIASRKVSTNTDDIDGGVIHDYTDPNAPKVIECTEITKFYCDFSLLTNTEAEELGNRVYMLTAILEGESVKCCIDWHASGDGEKCEFEAEPAFMEKLHEIVAKYDFAQYNGEVYTVSGLPDNFGSKLDIEYSSGESIYANDNQSVFLSMDAMKELVKLFRDNVSGR